MSDEKERPDIKTRFQLGNRFWERRSSHGRKPIFATPDKLWDACLEYFKDVEENPLIEGKLCTFNGRSWIESVPKMQIMTKNGLTLFLDITNTTWESYKENPDFTEVCEKAEKVIREQKLAGAAAGFLNPMIIARDLGLREVTDVDHSSRDGSMTPKANSVTVSMTPKEAAEAYTQTLSDESGS